MNGGNLYAQSAEGHNGRWNCTLCAEWGMKANVSVSWHDSVEYKWYCHWVLQKVSREFHSSKLHYLDRPEGIVSEWLEGKKVVSRKQKILQNNWLQAWKAVFFWCLPRKAFQMLFKFLFWLNYKCIDEAKVFFEMVFGSGYQPATKGVSMHSSYFFIRTWDFFKVEKNLVMCSQLKQCFLMHCFVSLRSSFLAWISLVG